MKATIKNIKTLLKTSIWLYLIFAVIILWSVLVYATVTSVINGYRISASSTSNLITSDSQHCVSINNYIPYDIFIPTKTLTERNAFINNHSSSITVSNYSPPVPYCWSTDGTCVNGTFSSWPPTCEWGNYIIRWYCYWVCWTVSSQCPWFSVGTC